MENINDKLIEIGEFYSELNNIINSNLPLQKIYRSSGFPSRLINHKHFNYLKHIDDIPEIIKNPDYIGINPNEDENTVELIKVFDKNILLGIKFNTDENYWYVSTMFEL